MTDFTIHDLERRVHERAQASPEVSYTRKLLDRGVAQCAKKLGEEAVEVVIAACSGTREEVVSETADLLYHLLVLLQARGVELEEVFGELQRRTRRTGLQEKAARKSGS